MEIKYRTRDLIKTIHRLDPVCRDIRLKLAAKSEITQVRTQPQTSQHPAEVGCQVEDFTKIS